MDTGSLWPLGLYFGLALTVAGSMIGISAMLGERHKDRATGEPYEAGIVPTGSARVRYSSRFFLVGMLFVIFDLEVVFLVAWAVAARELGWMGYAGASVFVGLLVVALIYEWRVGALEFGPSPKPRSLPKRGA